GRVIALNRRVTESNVKGISFLGQLFRNLGNFRAEDVIGPR
ncbi:MAG TPA: outer membrane protein assembly factor BamE, partial [Rhodovulum sp.]|nr:outer membrane protein assembly factor BamE [Rhodovulum sp.]